jgi:asparagine synthase (glutamine-hydrolysing)
MCGIAGELRSQPLAQQEHLHAMGRAIAHRGPDAADIWTDQSAGIGLVHRRLAIVDLTPAGQQPMTSASGRFVMIFNGEIYNHVALRAELDATGRVPHWRGHSDTETLLAGIDVWGFEQTLRRCIGMFAIALWDREQAVLRLARDRLGEKPLYFGWQAQGQARAFLFGSELKALRAHPSFEGRINRQALTLFMRHNYVPTPYSIYEGIQKLSPGCMVEVSLARREPHLTRYWSAVDAVRHGEADRARVWTPEAAVNELESLLDSAVAGQMMADVPLGAFLSGGIDSSAIVALMQKRSSRPVKTFTIGFHEKGYNEAEHAKAVARHLGTEHTELYVTPEEAMAVIPRLPNLFDEPFSDSSQIPTHLVSALARQQVTVSLSGDGGDELFSGYTRYSVASGLWQKLSRIPRPLRRAAAHAITAIPPATWTAIGQHLPIEALQQRLGDRLHKGAGILGNQSIDGLYRSLVSHWDSPGEVVLQGQEPPTLLTGNAHELGSVDTVERMMALDFMTYLPDDILVKLDRAAMAVSLETRVPMLDHRVVEFAWRLPQNLKQRDGVGKWVLRQVLYRHVPRALMDRPKMGFGIPIDSWLRGPLRDWAESLLSPERLQREGFFAVAPVRQKWDEHLSDERNWAYHLWDVLMFQSWLEVQTSD